MAPNDFIMFASSNHAMHMGGEATSTDKAACKPTLQMAVLQAEQVSTLRSLPPHVMHSLNIDPQPEYTCALCASDADSPYACFMR